MVQFASTQLTPRALRVSLSDPLYRITVGLFVATFVYSLVILGRATTTFVPQLGVGLAVILVVVSLVAYVVLISHLRIVAAAGDRRRARGPPGSPDPRAHLPGAARARPSPGARGHRNHVKLHAGVTTPGPPGILVAFDAAGLVAEARPSTPRSPSCPRRAISSAGRRPLPPGRAGTAATMMGSCLIGGPGARADDAPGPGLAFRILVDVAVKALSPAINDPTSAVMAIDQLHELLSYLGSRHLEVGQQCDVDGRVRLLVEMPSWEDYVEPRRGRDSPFRSGAAPGDATPATTSSTICSGSCPTSARPPSSTSWPCWHGRSEAGSRTPWIRSARASPTSKASVRHRGRPPGRTADSASTAEKCPNPPRCLSFARHRPAPSRHRLGPSRRCPGPSRCWIAPPQSPPLLVETTAPAARAPRAAGRALISGPPSLLLRFSKWVLSRRLTLFQPPLL